MPRTCEDLARNIHNFFSNSSKRQSEFVEFQIFTHVEVHKLLHPSQTRWLSLTSVVERIIEQWHALLLYFNQKWLAQKLVAAEKIHKGLNDPFIKLYFLFLKWSLPKFTPTNQFFQAAKVVITDLNEVMVDLYRDLLNLFMKRSSLYSVSLADVNPEDKSQYLSKSEMNLGAYVMQELQYTNLQARPDLIDYFQDRCQEFLVQACVEIRKRYDITNAVMEKLKIFKPSRALSPAARDGTPSIIPLLLMLQRVCATEQYQDVDDE